MYRKMGVQIGEHCKFQFDVVIDYSHYWHIKIGNNVTLAPRVHILAHDASTHIYLKHSRIGNVVIEDNVFVGAGTIILPGVKIGKNAIIGAGSVVTKDVPKGEVYAGNPAKFITKTDEYIQKQKTLLEVGPKYGEEYTLRSNVSNAKKQEMVDAVEDIGYGFIV